MDWRHSRPVRILILLLFTLSLLLGVLPYFLSSDALRQQIITQVESDTGRKLNISGRAQLVLLPRPALLVSNATLSEPNDSTIFAHADRIKVVLRLWPLLSQQETVVHAIEIDEPELNIVRNENGAYNFEDLLRPRNDKIKVALDNLTFNQARLSWKDEFIGEAVTISALDLRMSELTDPKKGQLSIGGHIAIGDDPKQPLWLGNITGEAAMRYLEKERTLRVADIQFDIVQSGESAPDWQLKQAQLQARGNLNYGWAPLKLTGGDMSVAIGAVRAGQHWSGQVDVPEIKLTDSALNLHRLKMQLAMKDQQTELAVNTSIPTLGGAHRSFLRTNNAQINVRYKSPQQQLNLQYNSPLELYRGSLIRLADYKLNGNYTNRSLPRGAIRFELDGRGDLDLRNEILNLESSGKLDGENVTTQINMENFLAPQYRLNLDVAKLDLTPYLPAVTAGAKTVDHAAQLDLWWLKELNAIGAIRIGELVLQNMHVDDLSMKLIARNQRLVLDPLSATIYEGRLNGRAEIDASKKPVYFRLEQVLSNMNINTLLTDVIDSSRFEGRSNLTIDIAAVGNKLSDLRHTAGGTVRVSLKQGAIRGIDIPALLNSASQQIKLMNGQITPSAQKDARTQFSALNATFNLKHGVASNNDLNVSAGILRLAGAGQIDLGRGEIDYRMQASANSQVSALSGLAGLVLPISFTGPLNAPVYKADYSSLKEQLVAKQQAEAAARVREAERKAAAAKAKAEAERKAAERKAAQQKAKAAAKPTPKPSKPR